MLITQQAILDWFNTFQLISQQILNLESDIQQHLRALAARCDMYHDAWTVFIGGLID